MKKQGFTLAEVLITLAIIGVVAAVSIPSVVANTQQSEFRTGLRKAVSVLNSAITMNMALDGESPYDNINMYLYLSKHMSVMKSLAQSPCPNDENWGNASFYTTDGMRFEFPYVNHNSISSKKFKLYENPEVTLRSPIYDFNPDTSDDPGKIHLELGLDYRCREGAKCAKCGSYGLSNNENDTVNAPCLVVVDVNGDKKPFPQDPNCFQDNKNNCKAKNIRKYSDPTGIKLMDTFSLMITDKQVIPYGVAAQRAMYQAQSGKK